MRVYMQNAKNTPPENSPLLHLGIYSYYCTTVPIRVVYALTKTAAHKLTIDPAAGQEPMAALRQKMVFGSMVALAFLLQNGKGFQVSPRHFNTATGGNSRAARACCWKSSNPRRSRVLLSSSTGAQGSADTLSEDVAPVVRKVRVSKGRGRTETCI